MTTVPSVATRVKRATAAIGKGASYAGMCEKFTRGHFGFPARYGSARLAYEASKRDGAIRGSMTPPAGVPVFWNILSGKNAPYDHVAMSVGGGWCISTSAGPGGTVAKVRIDELTRRWGMLYLGWGDHYHGVRVWKAPAKGRGSGASTGYPNTPVKATSAELKSGWYRLLGALGYKGSTTVRLQAFLRQSGHYTGPLDDVWGPGTTAALQRRLREAHRADSRIADPGPADGSRGSRTKVSEASYLNAHAWRAK